MFDGHICDVPGILVGHSSDTDALTGVTAIYCPNGAVPGVSVRGGAPGTRETDLMKPGELVESVNAILLCGGSAFGLDAATGAMDLLSRRGEGLDVGVARVPIVGGAVLFDLAVGAADVRPDAQMGRLALMCAGEDRRQGLLGAGLGASVGKFVPGAVPERSGLGSASIELGNGAWVGAIAAVNAGGDIYDPYCGEFLAGGRDASGKPMPVVDAMLLGAGARGFAGANTTIAALATNVRLDKAQVNRMATVAQDGFARAIRPVHTQMDGDTLFALSTGDAECDFARLCAMATEVVARAIANAGYLARERRA